MLISELCFENIGAPVSCLSSPTVLLMGALIIGTLKEAKSKRLLAFLPRGQFVMKISHYRHLVSSMFSAVVTGHFQ